MYNLIFALLINKVVLSDRSRKIASWAAALSMVKPICIMLSGLTGGTSGRKAALDMIEHVPG